MDSTKRNMLRGVAGLGLAGALPAKAVELPEPGYDRIADGAFKPNWESLSASYKTPDWFRDAKFGLWAHWGPGCVPEYGDWYARSMYLQGNGVYDHHVKTYGHPSDFGFMEFYPRWTAENWNPGELLDLYVKAGAKYFVAMANHHDNFDMFNSKFHDWNSVAIGPKKDIIGIWEKEARERGLKFGVSNHGAHAWHWFQTAYGYDPEGPRAGERYDAYKLTKLDGRGKWWEGLDPQALYGGAVMPLPDGIKTIAQANDWHEQNDRVWTEAPPLANPAFTRQWYLRCKDLIDSYKPDLVYFDNFDLPLGQAGLDIAAHYYNASVQWRGKLDTVLNIKPQGEPKKGYVADVERGFRAEISPEPWQTDTCIGHWHYDRRVYEQNKYLPAAAVIHRLCDIVSKNGNLLLSIPVRADGSIDDQERRIVEDIGEWMGRFSEAIYGTRPWEIYGEGPTQVGVGMFGESQQKPFTHQDIRFTTKDKALYAISLGRPVNGKLTIASLAKGAKYARGQVRRVQIVGDASPLDFRQDDKGLHISVPVASGHDIGVALKITGVV
ncbi:alpha-L-fucosidase [Asticcacaulis sp. ZE23SCel15]|uniref:alpha-L-fucosidase n=1 Tax=Asticcacaulis sp. ZE23SCel15 TaxID=3059027 RepID=UPI0026602C3B|nr:alpha-L-fucosidase [Asticcacaulis sp. ZE23SCel15]WKL58014.1 alpha-L-fucosidase [Asticcacaulis sp. ZE23SCel15]